MPAEDRPKVGSIANDVRAKVEAALDEARTRLETRACRPVDRRGRRRHDARSADPGGSLHPIDETIGEIARVFEQFGFVVYESPEVEDDVRNFQMLNIPPIPRHAMWDTLYVDVEEYLLRTHTSPGQIESCRPSSRRCALLPGRCFRYENVAADRNTEFFQVEGLMVDEHLHGRLRRVARSVRPCDVRCREADPFPARLLPVHRAIGRLRRRVPRLRRRGLPSARAG